ncbi:hypothetical protein SI65_07094 [Aspergillus cristatus]|uniref:Zn(2)-C6 fungal-type domain-containing protein n=1 Tax=Aspergillus cristatus TaxID=573508 RepID=A0A1E3B919_ASPCR|nr:hypothetical protein SI65_07094 [Aspergillus cristatus]
MAHQGSSRPLRPLAPRTASGGLAPANPDPSPNEEHKVKRASMACAKCKRRRTKCSYDTTGSPCTECMLQGCQCIVDESADKRRKVAAKRAEEENKRLLERVKQLEGSRDYERQFKELLLEAFREGDDDSAAAIIHSIRSRLPEDHILDVLNQVLDKAEDRASNLEDGVEDAQGGMMVDGVPPYYPPDYATR